MKGLARLGVASLLVTYLHLVFGGIVRISGAGMGCGDHWPKCNGQWLPPLDDPLVVIEWTHRLLATLVILAIGTFTAAAWRRRAEPGIGGRGGVLRAAATAFVLVLAVALLGMVTVKLGNSTFATLAHWTVAMALLGVLVAATVRAGGLGGLEAMRSGGSARAVRSLGAGAALAFVTVVLGGLVAKYPGAAVACPSFPLCGATPADVPAGASHIQLTHRVLAYLLFFHALMVGIAVGRRATEALSVRRAARGAAGLVILQLVLGATMVLSAPSSSLRALHQAVGIGVLLTLFLATYLARVAQMDNRKSELGAG